MLASVPELNLVAYKEDNHHQYLLHSSIRVPEPTTDYSYCDEAKPAYV